MKLNVLVVDDCREDVEELLQSLRAHEKIQWVDYCETSDEAIQMLENERIHLMFLDVKMEKGLSGIELANIVSADTLKVFVSHYPEFGADAFGVNEALHFLRKPVKSDELSVALDRAFKHFSLKNRLDQPKQHCYVRVDKSYRRIPYSEIIMVEGYHEHTKLFLEKEQIMTLVGMKPLLEQIKSSKFIRTHRSYAINVDHIRKLDNTSIWLTCDYEAPIGRTYRDYVIDTLLNGNVIERYNSDTGRVPSTDN